jgi:hypothetical protein
MKTHKTRVSNTPWKLGVLETSQRQFRRETKNIVKYVPVTLKLSYETHVETWLRSRLLRSGRTCVRVDLTALENLEVTVAYRYVASRNIVSIRPFGIRGTGD